MSASNVSDSPSKGNNKPLGDIDVASYRAERDRIKAVVFAAHGEEVAAFMEKQKKEGVAESPVKARERRLQDLISDKTVLRQQMHQAQKEAIEKLVVAAREESDRGGSPSQKLDILLKIEREVQGKKSVVASAT